MKKYLALLLVLVMVLSLAACASKPAETTDEPEQTTTEPAPAEETKDEEPAPAEETKEEEPTEEPADNTEYAVAMITDYGDITDQSFNQTTYEACKAFCEDNGVQFSYFKPAGDNTADRVAMIEKAVDEGYNVIVMPGYAFGGAIVEAAPEFPDVKFIALDVAKGDLLEAGVAKAGESYDYNPDNWDLEKYVDMSNVYCAIYQEELCGYMAGYAAVKLGYKSLGFLGGMAVPAVIRYGYGYVQGADAAAQELGTNVQMNYYYGGQFYGDEKITAKMDGWYDGGTEVVFACGGGIWTSAAEAADKHDGKLIGVDVDQNYLGVEGVESGKYKANPFVTSAMKGLGAAVKNGLDTVNAGDWSTIAGTNGNFGLEEGDYVGLPTDEASWNFSTFTMDEYNTVLEKIRNGEIKVDNNSDDATKPTTSSSMITQLMTTDSGICSEPTLTYSTVSSSIRACVNLFICFSSFLQG